MRNPKAGLADVACPICAAVNSSAQILTVVNDRRTLTCCGCKTALWPQLSLWHMALTVLLVVAIGYTFWSFSSVEVGGQGSRLILNIAQGVIIGAVVGLVLYADRVRKGVPYRLVPLTQNQNWVGFLLAFGLYGALAVGTGFLISVLASMDNGDLPWRFPVAGVLAGLLIALRREPPSRPPGHRYAGEEQDFDPAVARRMAIRGGVVTAATCLFLWALGFWDVLLTSKLAVQIGLLFSATVALLVFRWIYRIKAPAIRTPEENKLIAQSAKPLPQEFAPAFVGQYVHRRTEFEAKIELDGETLVFTNHAKTRFRAVHVGDLHFRILDIKQILHFTRPATMKWSEEGQANGFSRSYTKV